MVLSLHHSIRCHSDALASILKARSATSAPIGTAYERTLGSQRCQRHGKALTPAAQDRVFVVATQRMYDAGGYLAAAAVAERDEYAPPLPRLADITLTL